MSHELITAVNYNIPVVNVIFNNRSLGMVKQWQEMFYGGRLSQVDMTEGPDYVKLAEACGAVGYKVTEPEQVGDAVKQAIEKNRPVLIDVIVDPNENVFPMVPAGKPISEMLGVDFSNS